MDYEEKINILNKYFNKYAEEKNMPNMITSIKSMKEIHGKVLQSLLELKNSVEENKFELMSELYIISSNMSRIIMKNSKVYNCTLEKQSENDVKEFVEENPRVKLNKSFPSLILFYADWCGPCQKFLPIWGDIEKANIENINIMKYSCVEYKEVCQQLNWITSYPTIILHNPSSGEIIKYDGKRTIPDIFSFVEKHTDLKLL